MLSPGKFSARRHSTSELLRTLWMCGCFWANILVVYADSHRFPLSYFFGTLIDDLGCFPFDHGTYLPQSDSWASPYGIRSLIEFSNLVRPLAPSVLYLHYSFIKASPKAISRRTSYLRVRLEFLRYPQFIRCLFNDNQFGPPLDFTLASSWPWIGHSVSGLLYMTYIALFRLAFASAPYLT